MPALIETLSQLGIRFVFYSPHNYSQSRKLAARMGLSTGWNTAISLSEASEGGAAAGCALDEKLEWADFAQLPRGIAQIKEHLATQDNVPLLVHLFTHA